MSSNELGLHNSLFLLCTFDDNGEKDESVKNRNTEAGDIKIPKELIRVE